MAASYDSRRVCTSVHLYPCAVLVVAASTLSGYYTKRVRHTVRSISTQLPIDDLICKRIAIAASYFGSVFMFPPKTMQTGLLRPRHHAASFPAACLSGVSASTFTESCATEEMARESVAI